MDNNQEYNVYTIFNNDIKEELTDLGVIMKKILIRHNNHDIDIVLRFDKVQDYIANDSTYFGAVIDRNANRIEDSAFTLEGAKYKVEANDGEHNLHSGSDEYNTRVWDVVFHNEYSITFSLTSPHLDQGFSGELKMKVLYELTEDNVLKISYKGQSDRLTVFNPTNHSYFNLNGHDSGDVLHHKLCLNSDPYSELDEESIPTGKKLSVHDTVMDFTHLRMISEDKTEEYDDNFILKCNDLYQKQQPLSAMSLVYKIMREQ